MSASASQREPRPRLGVVSAPAAAPAAPADPGLQGALPVELSVELYDRWLRLTLPAVPEAGEPPRTADFHYVWLRLHCDADRHPFTREPLLDVTDVPDGIRPERAQLELGAGAQAAEGALVVRWAEPAGRVSRYPLSWLRTYAYALDRHDPARPARLPELTILAADHPSPQALVAEVLARVRSRGAAVVRGYGQPSALAADPADTEALITALGDAGLQVVGTHFGRIEDLRTDNTTNQNTDQLGYTDAGIDLHTDQPFLDRPPRYQLLHCIRPGDAGGENFIADGIAGAHALAAEDESAFRALRCTKVRFHRRQRAFEREVLSPILTLPEDGGSLVRCSYFTLAPQRLPFADVDPFFRAYRRYMSWLRDDQNLVRLRLQAGDFLLYDNHRMLHGRSAFTGPRWVRGVYFNEQDDGANA